MRLDVFNAKLKGIFASILAQDKNDSKKIAKGRAAHLEYCVVKLIGVFVML
jgi:hypothetical protein